MTIDNLKSYFKERIYNRLQKKCIDWFFYLPIKKNKIVFIFNGGGGYADSPKYIAEEIKKQNKPYHLVWLVNKSGYSTPSHIKQAKIGRIKSVYELATAKVIITTVKSYCDLKKKKNQFFIYVPHGQSGAKYVEKGAADKLGPKYIERSKWHSKVSDLFISSSAMQTQEMKDYFWCSCEIADMGLPRNDLFFNFTKNQVKKIKQTLGFEETCHLVLYAPTFRENKDCSVYDIDTKKILDSLKNRFGGEWKLLVRLHPNFKWFGTPNIVYDSNIVDVTSYEDMQELLIASDALISDYSSIMFDFNLLKRPIFLYTKDIEQYQDLRGLKPWFKQVPFPLCKTNEELLFAINHFDEIQYKQHLEEFSKIYNGFDDGHASERFVERLVSVIKS